MPSDNQKLLKKRPNVSLLRQIADVKHHRVEVMSCITSLEQDVEKYCDEAEEKHDMSLFLKSNALRKTIKDKKQVVKDLDFSISKLEEEAKSV